MKEGVSDFRSLILYMFSMFRETRFPPDTDMSKITMIFYCEENGLFDMVFLGSSTGGPFWAPGKVGSDMYAHEYEAY